MKPQNVLIAPDGTPKITDFGIARDETHATMTLDGVMMGTPHYMSPEQAEGSRADARSDVYALGCIAYQMLTGELPFSGDTPLAVLRKHVEQQVRPIATLKANIPTRLARVVERAMAKDPVFRYSNADEMAKALREAMPRLVSRGGGGEGGGPGGDGVADAANRRRLQRRQDRQLDSEDSREARKRVLDEENRAVDERKVERARERPSALRALVSALLVLGFIVAIVVTAVILFWPRHDDEIVEVVPSLTRPVVAAVINETSVSVESPEVAAAIDEASVSVKGPEIVTFVVDTSLSMAGGNLIETVTLEGGENFIAVHGRFLDLGKDGNLAHPVLTVDDGKALGVAPVNHFIERHLGAGGAAQIEIAQRGGID